MTPAEMVAMVRDLARDTKAPYLRTDAQIVRDLNEGQREACRRARLIEDTTTDTDGVDPVCLYPLTLGQTLIALHPSVLWVRRVKLDSAEQRIPPIRREDLDMEAPGWETHAAQQVVAYCPNYQRRKLRLYTASPAVDNARLTVIRLPITTIALETGAGTTLVAAVPAEIEPHHHEGLVHWSLMRYAQKPGAETWDPAAVKMYSDAFDAEFGPKASAIDETWIFEKHGYDEFEGLF